MGVLTRAAAAWVLLSRGRVDTIGTDPHRRFLGKWNCGRRLIVRCQGNGADGSEPDPGVKGPRSPVLTGPTVCCRNLGIAWPDIGRKRIGALPYYPMLGPLGPLLPPRWAPILPYTPLTWSL